MLGHNDNYEMKVTCDNNFKFCQNDYFAHMNDNSAIMNIFDAWFDPKGTPAEEKCKAYLEETENILKNCHDIEKTKFKTLNRFSVEKGVFDLPSLCVSMY